MTLDSNSTSSPPTFGIGTMSSGFPPDAFVRRISFRDVPEPGETVLLSLPPPGPRCAMECATGVDGTGESSSAGVTLLCLPAPILDDVQLELAQGWVDGRVGPDRPLSVVLTLQGVRVIWSRERIAILAPRERIPGLAQTLVEFAFHESELRRVESDIAGRWGDLSVDSSLAFEVNTRSLRQSGGLAERFQRVVALRARLAQISPLVHRPAVHPPTLASQVGERLRERTRLEDRLERTGEQLEVFERVYEMSSQRLNDFQQSQRGHTLEMIIIVLLAVQTLLVVVELLSARSV